MKGLNCQHHQPSIKYYLHDPHDQLSNEKSFFAHQLNSIAFRMLYAVIKTCIRSTIKCFWCVLTTTNYWIIKHKTNRANPDDQKYGMREELSFAARESDVRDEWRHRIIMWHSLGCDCISPGGGIWCPSLLSDWRCTGCPKKHDPELWKLITPSKMALGKRVGYVLKTSRSFLFWNFSSLTSGGSGIKFVTLGL